MTQDDFPPAPVERSIYDPDNMARHKPERPKVIPNARTVALFQAYIDAAEEYILRLGQVVYARSAGVQQRAMDAIGEQNLASKLEQTRQDLREFLSFPRKGDEAGRA